MHSESQPRPTPAGASASFGDAVLQWLAPSAPAADAGPRTEDEAQEMLARDWHACELQAIRLGCYCW